MNAPASAGTAKDNVVPNHIHLRAICASSTAEAGTEVRTLSSEANVKPEVAAFASLPSTSSPHSSLLTLSAPCNL